MGRRFSELSVITDVGDNVLLSGVDPDDTSYSVDGTNKIFSKANLLKELKTGWNPSPSTFTYSSVDNPTGVITCTGANTFLSVGMRVKFTNATNTIYGIITVVTSTTFTFLHEMATTGTGAAVTLMANSAITNPSYSTQKAPFGFPTSPLSWSLFSSIATDVQQTDPVNGTWYNGLSITTPIGAFRLEYFSHAFGFSTGGLNLIRTETTLSTANNSESDRNTTVINNWREAGTDTMRFIQGSQTKEIVKVNTSKTIYYFNARVLTDSVTTLYINFSVYGGTILLRATCAYL